jgi:polar amino acid transport system substrate-binding protein
MRWKSKVCSLIALWQLSLPQEVFATSFEVGFYNYPPMMIEEDRSGIYQDIFNAISKLTDDTFNVSYYPYPRVGLMFNQARLDIEPGVYPGWVKDQKIPGLFSVPFGRVVDVMVFAPGKAFPVKKPEDLRGKSVGMVRGYSYPDLQLLIDGGRIDRRDALNENQLLKMLWAKRFDQILISKAVAQYNFLKMPEYRLFEVGDEFNHYDVSMRVNPKLEAWLPKLDEAILQLKNSGEIERIYAKYGVHL